MQRLSYQAIRAALAGDNVPQIRKIRDGCRAMLKARPDSLPGLRLMGEIEYRLGQFSQAEKWFKKALAIRPGSAELRYNYAQALAGRQRYAAAIRELQNAVALRPEYSEAYYSFGLFSERCGDETGAIEAYRKAIAINPNYAAAMDRLGIIFMNQGALTEALLCFRKVLAFQSGNPDTLNHIGTIYHHQGEFEKSIAYFRQALAVRPDYPVTLNNLGVALKSAGKVQAAIAVYEQALALKRNWPELETNLAMALLASGDMERGWQKFEWRLKSAKLFAARPKMVKPRWQGGMTKQGRTLLIRAEQGYGDTLQFCRYVPLAAKLGLRVILEVQPPLVRLLRALDGVSQVLAYGQPLPDFDFYCPMMSLPLAFHTQLATIPANVPYLSVPEESIGNWRKRMPDSRDMLKVGLVWAGKRRVASAVLAAADHRRSIDPSLFAPLLSVEGVQFYSLQKEGPAAPVAAGLIDMMTECQDFADTAALIANLDLVISVDTAVAHLAGAMGKPVWLLNRFDGCWRWLQQREDSPWYPSLRLFRQAQPGEWENVIALVCRELQRLAGQLR
ncbi:hypothetical protein P22_2959 [Propionispora sp. 2/2-37]|uniref:tetratricopeptide repeat protein n=1 Tax=Propionispora sp. 2/2-37 TaxID=1677858 RepID=UPI0006BB72E8|nr:tetratricopeptide repeat protein [Propionispora sp. 2/2-37]CUH96848.1 hypothetical protein P22_2959 [Propionispora sp. 2/2-37]